MTIVSYQGSSFSNTTPVDVSKGLLNKDAACSLVQAARPEVPVGAFQVDDLVQFKIPMSHGGYTETNLLTALYYG